MDFVIDTEGDLSAVAEAETSQTGEANDKVIWGTSFPKILSAL